MRKGLKRANFGECLDRAFMSTVFVKTVLKTWQRATAGGLTIDFAGKDFLKRPQTARNF